MGSPGYERLWAWFGLSRASWVTLPRAFLHEMPDEWQDRLAALLEEYDEHWWRSRIGIGTRVQATRNGRLVPMPDVLINYRHAMSNEIERLRTGEDKL